MDERDRRKAADAGLAVQSNVARARIARLVVGWSIAGTLIFAGLAVVVPGAGVVLPAALPKLGADDIVRRRAAADAAQSVFTTVLPIVSGWTGAVIAYYFTHRAYEDANQTTREFVREMTTLDRWRAMPVRATMRLPHDIESVALMRERSGDRASRITTPLSSLLDVIEHGRRSRIPLIEQISGASVLVYVIHESTLFEFLRRRRESVESLTVADLLSDEGSRRRLEGTLGYISVDKTLADAKALMDANSRLQDVIVTASGRPDGNLVGWLTNVDVLRHCVAGATSQASL
jgi:CBS domain-containing protein